MSRKHFQSGVSLYKEGKFEEALGHLDKAASASAQPNYLILDTRAAVLAKLGRLKDALKDAKATIEAAPERWQGYARAARLFLSTKKIDASNTMIKLALEKLKEEDATRRVSLLALQSEIEEAARRADERRRRYTNHSANLPLEIFGEIVAIANQDDRSAFITMSHVCKSWRTAIHSMPLLWDSLILTGRHTKKKAALWMEMSRGNIRELEVRESATHVPEFPSACLAGLKWENLRVFKTEYWDPTSYLISIGREDGLYAINHLDINTFATRYLPIPVDRYGQLSHLSVRGFTPAVNVIEGMAGSMTNLKSLTLQQPILDYLDSVRVAFMDLIKANTYLESLYLDGTAIAVGDPDNDLCWEHLTSLTLKRMPERAFVAARLPALETLHVESRFSAFHLFLRKLPSTIATTPSRISTLILRSCPVDATLFTDVLRHLHELHTLEITNVSSMANHVTEALAASYVAKATDTPEGPLICPKLTDINFSSCSDLQTGPVVRMIRSRLVGSPPQTDADPAISGGTTAAPSVERIRSLKIDECANIDPEWLVWIRNNVEQVSCVYMKKKTKFRAA